MVVKSCLKCPKQQKLLRKNGIRFAFCVILAAWAHSTAHAFPSLFLSQGLQPHLHELSRSPWSQQIPWWSLPAPCCERHQEGLQPAGVASLRLLLQVSLKVELNLYHPQPLLVNSRNQHYCHRTLQRHLSCLGLKKRRLEQLFGSWIQDWIEELEVRHPTLKLLPAAESWELQINMFIWS